MGGLTPAAAMLGGPFADQYLTSRVSLEVDLGRGPGEIPSTGPGERWIESLAALPDQGPTGP